MFTWVAGICFGLPPLPRECFERDLIPPVRMEAPKMVEKVTGKARRGGRLRITPELPLALTRAEANKPRSFHYGAGPSSTHAATSLIGDKYFRTFVLITPPGKHTFYGYCVNSRLIQTPNTILESLAADGVLPVRVSRPLSVSAGRE